MKYKGYTMTAAIFNKFEIAGRPIVPYCLGSIVTGPRGGTYMLDMCCTEMFVRLAFPKVMPGNELSVLIREATAGGVRWVNVSKPAYVSYTDARKLAKELNCSKVLITTNGLEVMKAWK